LKDRSVTMKSVDLYIQVGNEMTRIAIDLIRDAILQDLSGCNAVWLKVTWVEVFRSG
jgi:hypothetical protein